MGLTAEEAEAMGRSMALIRLGRTMPSYVSDKLIARYPVLQVPTVKPPLSPSLQYSEYPEYPEYTEAPSTAPEFREYPRCPQMTSSGMLCDRCWTTGTRGSGRSSWPSTRGLWPSRCRRAWCAAPIAERFGWFSGGDDSGYTASLV